MSTAETRAFETIREHWMNEDDNKVTFPIDPYIIAERMGLRVEHRVGLPDDVSVSISKNPKTPLPWHWSTMIILQPADVSPLPTKLVTTPIFERRNLTSSKKELGLWSAVTK